jgi:endonuclease/exonuclease/phosphatase family metal-dependent hydrolase
MTWNVRHSTPTGEIVGVVEELIDTCGLDVVCLQEVTAASLAPPRFATHRALARATGWKVSLASHPRLYPGWVEGVAILTHLPILARRRARLSPNRSYLQAVIRDTELGELSIGCIHLSSPDRREPELRRALHGAPPHRFVLAGDFNLRASDPALRTALASYRSDGLPGVDHVYLSADLRIVEARLEPTAPSDHDAVIAWVQASSS